MPDQPTSNANPWALALTGTGASGVGKTVAPFVNGAGGTGETSSGGNNGAAGGSGVILVEAY
jgi:hypothetical protein